MDAHSINEARRADTLILARIDKRMSGFTPGADKGLWLDAQAISDPIDVVEKADDLGSVMDSGVIQPGAAQGLDVGFAHGLRLKGQLFGIGAQRGVGLIQGRRPPVARNRIDKGVSFGLAIESFDLGTEVMGMGLDSVDAVIGFADNHRQHLALLPRQGRIGKHSRAVHLHRGLHHAPIERHNLNDIPDAPGALDGFFQFLFE